MIIENNPNSNNTENPEDREEAKEFLEKFKILDKHFHKAAESVVQNYEDLHIDLFNTADTLRQLRRDKEKLADCFEKYQTEGTVSKKTLQRYKDFIKTNKASEDFVQLSFLTYEEFSKNEIVEVDNMIQEALTDIMEGNIIFQIIVSSRSETGDYNIDHATSKLVSIIKKMCKNYFQSNITEDPGLYKDLSLLDEDGDKVNAFITESGKYASRLITLIPIFPKAFYRHPNAGNNGGNQLES
jgi:hypothetical protein